jgi:hypothetical protein
MMMAFDAPGLMAPAFLPDAFVSPQNIATLRLASAGFVSAAGDTPATTYFEPRILGDIEIGQSRPMRWPWAGAWPLRCLR